MQVSNGMVVAALDAFNKKSGDYAGASSQAMLAALEAALAAMWRDISTAPKDGERVLLGWRKEMSAEGYWNDGSTNYWKLAGFYFADDDVLTGKPCNPECWQPLPVPPAGQEG